MAVVNSFNVAFKLLPKTINSYQNCNWKLLTTKTWFLQTNKFFWQVNNKRMMLVLPRHFKNLITQTFSWFVLLTVFEEKI